MEADAQTAPRHTAWPGLAWITSSAGDPWIRREPGSDTAKPLLAHVAAPADAIHMPRLPDDTDLAEMPTRAFEPESFRQFGKREASIDDRVYAASVESPDERLLGLPATDRYALQQHLPGHERGSRNLATFSREFARFTPEGWPAIQSGNKVDTPLSPRLNSTTPSPTASITPAPSTPGTRPADVGSIPAAMV